VSDAFFDDGGYDRQMHEWTGSPRRVQKHRNVFLPAILACASFACAAGKEPDLLVKKIASLAGANATDCGVASGSGDRAAAIVCARDAAAAGKPYRLVIELKGSDSYTWQGAARDERGRQWVVFYDADASAGAAASPGLGQLLCRSIRYAPDKDEAIDCQPSTGEP